jgi:integrase
MSPLRMRMIEDMTLAGLSPGTQAIYIDAVRELAAYYRRSLDQPSEEEVRAYILNLRERGAARGTFKANYGIRYLYRYTLNRDWAVFSKKNICLPRQKRLPHALADAEARRLLGCITNPIHRTRFAVMYDCGLRIGEAATLEIGTIGDKGLLRIIGKGNKERLVPLPEPMLIARQSKVRLRLASPGNVPQSATVASLKMFPLPHAAAECPFFCSTRAASILSFSKCSLECKRFVIFPLDSILLFDRAAGILPPRPQTCLATARSGGQ